MKLDKSLKPLPGHLSLKSIPSGAVIWVDGKMSKLKTDVKAKISAGKHTITLKIDQYVDAEKDIDILPGSVLEETFQLVKDRGKINVVSIPEGAAIWIGGEDTGKKTDHLMKVLHGEHEITIKLDGYKDALKKVRLEPEGFTEVEFRLEKGSNVSLPGSIITDPITGMEFIYVPGGKFMMGDIFGDEEEEAEKPVHEVVLDGFYIGKYPVTQGEWEAVMGDNPSNFKEGDSYPVEEVSWNDAQEFFKKLISKNNERYQFRLPTEAEWEYAARSGGKKEKYAGSNDVDAVAWYDGNSEETTHPVGKKLPNGLGIYDMSGNVWEWCQDRPPGFVTNRVARGGGWNSLNYLCRSDYHFGLGSGNRINFLGFRLAFSPGQVSR